MGLRIARQLGFIFWILDVAVIASGAIVFATTPGMNRGGALIGTYAMVTAFLAFPTMGALIIWQRPRNTVGWIFCAIGLGTAWTSMSAAIVNYALMTHTDTRPIVGLVDVLGNTVWPLNLGLGTLLLFLFPTGRLPSPRWRFVFWADVVLIVVAALAGLLTPGYLETGNRVWNPLGLPVPRQWFDMVTGVGGILFAVCALASVASIIVRYVTSRDIQRQQIKWFAMGTAAMVLIVVPSFIIIPEQNFLSNVAFALGIVMLPIGAGIGVLRYRLFDIDVIIRRTLVYGSLTAILAGIYYVAVVRLQMFLNVSSSPIVIVITTLLIAALFQPLRRGLQGFIDRRFYRARYDVRKTLDAFGASLRSEVELAHLTEHLLTAVEQTMHPAHVSLWLREQPARQTESGHAS